MPLHLARCCALALALSLPALATAGCGPRDPRTAEEQRARGEERLKAMSARLAGARTIAVTTTEEVTRVTRDGERRVDHFRRELKMRRPDRLYSRSTGTRDLETFYEGDRLTVISHHEKVFGEFATPPTLDDTIDVIAERYGIALPLGDLLTDNAYDALVNRETRGGWAAREVVDGVACERFTWHHPRVDWTIWIPASGDPLPRRMHVVYTSRRGRPDATVTFKQWDLRADVSDATFVRRVPEDYEGIAVIQRASAVTPSDEPTAAATSGRR